MIKLECDCGCGKVAVWETASAPKDWVTVTKLGRYTIYFNEDHLLKALQQKKWRESKGKLSAISENEKDFYDK